MSSNDEEREGIRDFLVSRRAKITPEQAGLTAYGRNRRVKGLRREEAAMLAGISVEYYTRLERGIVRGVSESVLGGISDALQLNGAERSHLVDLLRAAVPPRQRQVSARVRPAVQRLLDSMGGVPAFVLNGRLDILAHNGLGAALYSPMFEMPKRPVNHARFIFLNPASKEFWSDWDKAANDTVALLRVEAGRNRTDRKLTDLVGELSTQSQEFSTRWAAHNVRTHNTGIKRIHHPLVGEMQLPFESFPVAADAGQIIMAFTPEPDSRAAESLSLLASWSTQPAEADAFRPPGMLAPLNSASTPPLDPRSKYGIAKEVADHQGPSSNVHRRRLV
ncbi:transcriptional regulator [Arthrobacter sp. 7749]|nr:transcriptional regulator [Arthrobacter sp. 7749]